MKFSELPLKAVFTCGEYALIKLSETQYMTTRTMQVREGNFANREVVHYPHIHYSDACCFIPFDDRGYFSFLPNGFTFTILGDLSYHVYKKLSETQSLNLDLMELRKMTGDETVIPTEGHFDYSRANIKA